MCVYKCLLLLTGGSVCLQCVIAEEGRGGRGRGGRAWRGGELGGGRGVKVEV